MHQLSVIRIVGKQSSGDCGIAALAMYLGKNYEDVLTVAATTTNNMSVHRSGVYATDVMRISAQLGRPLKQRRKWDEDAAFGIVFVDFPGKNRHAVLVKEGMIYDPEDFTVWDYDEYFLQNGGKPMMLLTELC